MIEQIILVTIAGICLAFSETIKFHEGGIFHEYDFFNINKQGKFLPFTKFPLDGYHVFKSIGIIAFVSLASTHSLLPSILNILFLGTILILVFNLFFNKLLK